MSREAEKEMKKILTEIRTIDNILYRDLWLKNILEDKVTAILYNFMPSLGFLLIIFLLWPFHPIQDSIEKIIFYGVIIISVLSLFFVSRTSKSKIKDIERYDKNLRCWRRYLVKERDDLLEENPSLKDVKPGLSGRLIWDVIHSYVTPFLVLFMFVAVNTGILYEFFCLISGSIGIILFLALYMGLDRPYEGKPCIENE